MKLLQYEYNGGVCRLKRQDAALFMSIVVAGCCHIVYLKVVGTNLPPVNTKRQSPIEALIIVTPLTPCNLLGQLGERSKNSC